MVVEVLSLMLTTAGESGLFHGLLAGPRADKVTHLQFADDTLVFLQFTPQAIPNVIRIFKWFEAISGLKINFAKSMMLGINVEQQKIQNLGICGLYCWGFSGIILRIATGLWYTVGVAMGSVKVALRIEKLQRDFLWDDSGESKKLRHLMNWDIVTKSKRDGGLGIGKLRLHYKSLVGKWLWRYGNEKKALWRTVVDAKCGMKKEDWTIKNLTAGKGSGS
ncbi:uncharacterized protein LOC143861251 [Tasmannia lanceolata]|uniref:uncharacterized protein LOC143861251 n=1 Tax=Tasmannia lanceolata TaxID=3420 RepID=UPI004062ECF7